MKTTEVKSPVSGQLVGYSVAEGDHVASGRNLATIAPDQSQALLLSQAVTEERVRRIARDQAVREYLRARELYRTGVSPATVYDTAKAARDAAAEAYDLAQKQVRILEGRTVVRGNSPSRTFEVRAPVDGLVLKPLVAPGEAVIAATTGSISNAGTTLLKIADTTSTLARLNVSEVDIDKIRVGMAAIVRPASGAREYKGHVVRVGLEASTLEPLTTFEADVKLDDNVAFRPGMTADVDVITVERSNVRAIPASAVVRDGGTAAVVLADGRRQMISTGIDDGDFVEVVRGLDFNDVIRVAPGTSAPSAGAR